MLNNINSDNTVLQFQTNIETTLLVNLECVSGFIVKPPDKIP